MSGNQAGEPYKTWLCTTLAKSLSLEAIPTEIEYKTRQGYGRLYCFNYGPTDVVSKSFIKIFYCLDESNLNPLYIDDFVADFVLRSQQRNLGLLGSEQQFCTHHPVYYPLAL